MPARKGPSSHDVEERECQQHGHAGEDRRLAAQGADPPLQGLAVLLDPEKELLASELNRHDELEPAPDLVHLDVLDLRPRVAGRALAAVGARQVRVPWRDDDVAVGVEQGRRHDPVAVSRRVHEIERVVDRVLEVVSLQKGLLDGPAVGGIGARVLLDQLSRRCTREEELARDHEEREAEHDPHHDLELQRVAARERDHGRAEGRGQARPGANRRHVIRIDPTMDTCCPPFG